MPLTSPVQRSAFVPLLIVGALLGVALLTVVLLPLADCKSCGGNGSFMLGKNEDYFRYQCTLCEGSGSVTVLTNWTAGDFPHIGQGPE